MILIGAHPRIKRAIFGWKLIIFFFLQYQGGAGRKIETEIKMIVILIGFFQGEMHLIGYQALMAAVAFAALVSRFC